MAPSAAPAPDHGVQLVDEQHDVLGALDLVERALESLLELAAVLGAGDHGAEVEREHAPAAQQLRHVGVDDLLREPVGDGRLAHAGLADQHRVVLGPAAEHLDDALDLLVAADDRVELALASHRREVARVLLEHALAGGAGLVVGAGGAHLGQRVAQPLLGHADVPEDGAAGTLALEEDAEAAGARCRRTRRPSSAPPGRRGRGRPWRAASCRASRRARRGRWCPTGWFCAIWSARVIRAPLSMPRMLRSCSTTPPGRLSTPISRCSVPSTLRGPRRTTPCAVSRASRARSENLFTSIVVPWVDS